MSGNNIKVVCRFRPQNKLEIREGGVPIVEISEDGTGISLKGKDTNTFSFDKCFGSNTRQQEIFEYSIKSIVDDVVAGYNGTVFAYGQTGSGKTYTMMGSSIDDPENKGIIPRIIEQIFTSIQQAPINMEFTVKVAYMEIYMERVKDLLVPQNDNLPIHEDKVKGVYVKGIKEVYVSDTSEVYDVMRIGGDNRVVASTNMNAESSRSHSIVLTTITQKNLDTGAAKSGKLYLVDLAGSEKVGKTGASGQTLEEAKKINKSLTALGMVINSLTDGKSSHVPYRDSKLTRILQESLGGNSRTTLIINCSPSSYNEAESISTLRFGARAKTIKNKAKVNADLSPAELKALLKRVKGDAVSYKAYISALENEISMWRLGKVVPENNWASMDGAKAKPIAAAAATAANTTAPITPPQTPAPAFKLSVDDDSRPSTPAMVLGNDEKEEFIKREQELLEQITEKAAELASREKQVTEIQEMLEELKKNEKELSSNNKLLSSELSEAQVQLEKESYEKKEGEINIDSLKEANLEYMSELEELKATLARLEAAESKNVEQLQATEEAMENAEEKKQGIEADLDIQDITPEAITKLRHELQTTKAMIEQHKVTIANLEQERDSLSQKRDDLEVRFSNLEVDYEELLDKTIAMEEMDVKQTSDIADSISELKTKLESQFIMKSQVQQKEIDSLKADMEKKTKEEERLISAMNELQAVNDKLMQMKQEPGLSASSKEATEQKERELERMRKSMAQELADFETMKKVLMRDLQGRCERVVELEMTLDEVRIQQSNMIKATSNKAQQKKMFLLERNLDQLTNVQKQLVEQNSHLKKESALSERKLSARNERIQNLEYLLQEAQNKLLTQNDKFESQLQAVRGRLEQARTHKSQGNSMLNFNRIAKPLRGGGAAVESSQEEKLPEKREKRTSWFR
ncbi:U4/U6 x U5 tri-snRNP complex subunit Prp1 [Mucor velutinosus]|uniref:Kinesin-like protein n=1 Tax=Mucor velutinosus TaxID=708070 RepID=A0AAN7DR30_9FUNG|nr:U4/U6 x U5 tri-snRNP complex subunit Prp1 [Mucor velutinosus]